MSTEKKPKGEEEESVMYYHGETFIEDEDESTETFSIFQDRIVIENKLTEKVSLVLPFEQIFGVHRFVDYVKLDTEFFEKNEGVSKNSDGVVICCLVKKEVKKYAMFLKKKEVRKVASIIQQLVFLVVEGKEFVLDKAFKLLKKADRRMLILVNPISGTKKGVQKMKKVVKPMLTLAHMTFDFVVTKRAGHASTICAELDIDKYNEVGALGGDGFLFECLQGLMNHKKYSYKQMLKIPLCPLNCGTGNALAFSVGVKNSCEMACFMAARGKTAKLDLFSLFVNNKRLYCFLQVSYAITAEVDHGLENVRFVDGDLKYLLGALYYILKGTHHDCKFRFYQQKGKSSTPKDPKRPLKKSSIFTSREVFDKKDFQDKKKTLPCPVICQKFMSEMKTVAPKLLNSNLISNDSAKKEDGKVTEKILSVFFWILCNTAHIAPEFTGSPNKQINEKDGMDVIYAHADKLSLITRVKKLVHVMNGSQLTKDDVFMSHRVRALYFEPSPQKTSTINFDGENIGDDYGPILMEHHNGVATVFTM